MDIEFNRPAPVPLPPRERANKPVIPDHTCLRMIGRGSYGEVWLGRNLMGEFRAIKIISARGLGDERAFEREFEGIKRFEPISRSHESQVDILHVGQNGDCFYYVMELADDANVQDLNATSSGLDPATYRPKTLRSELSGRGRLPAAECLRIGLALSTALEHLHQHGLVHRDIKPSNIIFVNGIPKLADIGLVTDFDATRSFVGTHGFFPPEGPGTPQADIFSLGKVLYEISTGRDRNDFPELPTNLRADTDAPALVEFNEVVLKACDSNPLRRYQSAVELQADLALLQVGKSLKRARVMEQRLATVRKLSIATILFFCLAVTAFFYQKGQTQKVQSLASENLRLAFEARAKADDARANLYAADISQIQHALDHDNVRQAVQLLRKQIPKRGETDLRGFEWRYLWKQCQPQELFNIGPQDAIAAGMAVSPDSRFLALGFEDKATKVFDIKSRQIICELADQIGRIPSLAFFQDGIHSLSFSPGADLLAAASPTNVWIWDTKQFHSADKSAKQPIQKLAGAMAKAMFSPNGRYLMSCKSDGLILWDTATWKVIGNKELEPMEISFVFSKDSEHAAAAATDGIHLLNIPSLKETHFITEPMPTSRSIAFSPDGRALAASTRVDSVIKLWDIEARKELKSIVCHSDTVTDVTFSPDGKTFATCSADQTVKIWEFTSGKLLRTLRGHTAEVWHVQYLGDGAILASGSRDGAVKFWDVHASEQVETPITGWGAGVTMDGHVMSVGGRLNLHDPETRNKVDALATQVGRVSALLRAHSGRAATIALKAPKDDSWGIWDLASRARLCSIPCPLRSPWFGVAPSLRIVAALESTNVVRLWHLPSGPSFYLTNAGVDMSFSLDETMIATCGEPCDAIIWNIEGPNPRPIRRFPEGIAAAFSPDGKQVAVGFYGGAGLKLFEIASGRLVKSFVGFKREGIWPAFSPDGKTIATVCDDRTLRLWHVQTGRQLMEFTLEQGDIAVGSIGFSADGRVLAQEVRNRTTTIGGSILFAPSFDEIALHDGTFNASAIPRDPVAWHERGKALAKYQRYNEALEAFSSAIHGCGTQAMYRLIRNGSLARKTELLMDTGNLKEAGEANCERLDLSRRDQGTSAGAIDLSAYYNGSLERDSFLPTIRAEPFLTGLPSGLQVLPGVPDVRFDLRGALHLNSNEDFPGIPRSVEGIPVSQKASHIHFLHGAGRHGTNGVTIASFVVHYVDGAQAQIPIVYGVDVRHWKLQTDPLEASQATAAWSGTNETGEVIRFFDKKWENPMPDREIRAIDFVSALSGATPWLLAITLEP